MKDIAGDIISTLRNISAKETANKLKHKHTGAVIVTAGNGTRFDAFGAGTKQMALLRGIPVIVRTIFAFEECDCIDEIVIVARANEVSQYEDFRKKYNFKKIKAVVEGGETRQISSLKGFDALSPKCKYVAVHDGARCLITPDMITKVVDAAYETGASAAASKARDTIKYADKDGYIESTIDRNYVWLVQTPQVFSTNIYRASAYMAKRDGAEATDDCMLAERLGFKIRLVDCGGDNIKMTLPEDMYIAQSILERRGETDERFSTKTDDSSAEVV
jgi:2-C-methyl-D-erythritol 4-phosphate cytidylyltransferase